MTECVIAEERLAAEGWSGQLLLPHPMKRIGHALFWLIVPLFGLESSSHAQLFTYSFSDVTTSSGTSSLGGTASGLTFSSFTAVTGDTNSGSAGLMSFDSWPTGATTGSNTFTGSLSTTSYYQFSVTPGTNTQFTLTSLAFTAGRSSTGPRQFSIRSSLDSFSANLSGTPNASLSTVGSNVFQFTDVANDYTGNTITLSSASFANQASAVTFRVYGFNSEGGSGTFRIDNFSINGSVSAVPEPSTYAAIMGAAVLAVTTLRKRKRAAVKRLTSAA